MTLDYRTMAPGDWTPLVIIIVLCIIISVVLIARPMVPWRSTQRWRAPDQSEDELGEPTPGFRRGCKVIAAAVIIAGLLCILMPFIPAIRG